MDMTAINEYVLHSIRIGYQQRQIPSEYPIPIVHATYGSRMWSVTVETGHNPPIRGYGGDVDDAVNDWFTVFDRRMNEDRKFQIECNQTVRRVLHDWFDKLDLHDEIFITGTHICCKSFTIVGQLLSSTVPREIRRLTVTGDTLDIAINSFMKKIETMRMEKELETQLTALSTSTSTPETTTTEK